MRSVRFVCWFVVFVFVILAMVLAGTGSQLRGHAIQPSPPSAVKIPPAGSAAQPVVPGSGLPPAKFANAVTYRSGPCPYSVAVGDVNGDGIPDLVVANWTESGYCLRKLGNGGVSVLLGNGDGTFQAPVTYSSGGYGAWQVAIADVNGDGKPDLIVVNDSDSGDGGNGNVSILLGNGDGTFQAPVSYDSGGGGAVSLAVADLNGDGFPDVAVVNEFGSGSGSGTVGVLLNNGDGTFQAAVSYSSGGSLASEVAIGDLSGDGYPDLVVTNYEDGTVGVLLNNGDGTFQAAVVYATGGWAQSVAIGDLRSDGKLDLVVSEGSEILDVLLGNGDGTFQRPVFYNVHYYGVFAVTLGDVNCDGHLDVEMVLQSKSGNGASRIAGVVLGNGDGTLQTSAHGYKTGGKSATGVTVADLNGDGRPDIVATNPASSTVGVLLNVTLIPTTTTVGSSPNPSQVNQLVAFTATITATRPIPDGEVVTFYHGKTKLGSGTTENGVATLTTSFSKAGNYAIKASYPGDDYLEASSGTVKQVVEK